MVNNCPNLQINIILQKFYAFINNFRYSRKKASILSTAPPASAYVLFDSLRYKDIPKNNRPQYLIY